MFGGDPFGNPFNHMRRQMQEMDNMMNSIMGGDPFAGMLGPMMGGRNLMIMNDQQQHQQQQQQQQQQLHQRNMAAQNPAANMMLNPFGGGMFGGLMQQMNNFQNHAINDPNSTVFTQSTMISYGNDGQPHVVQSSTRKAGDVKETRHSVQKGDLQKMTVGHAIGDRAHYIEKKRDKDGRIRQQQKFVNLDEEEAEDFNHEFKSRVTNNLLNSVGGSGSRASRQKAIEAPSSSKSARRKGESAAPIVTVPDDDEEEDFNYRESRISKKSTPKPSNYIEEEEDDIEFVYSNQTNGPTIREISDEEADMTIPKRRKGLFGKFLRSNNE